MFIGEYSHTLDIKGRLSLPSKFRTELGVRVVVTKGLDHCLFVYSLAAWEALAQKMSRFPVGDADTRAFVRMTLSGATDLDVDRSGRVLLPEYLRSYASLEKNTVVSGVYDKIEIWDAIAWKTYTQEVQKNAEASAQKLGDLGLY